MEAGLTRIRQQSVASLPDFSPNRCDESKPDSGVVGSVPAGTGGKLPPMERLGLVAGGLLSCG